MSRFPYTLSMISKNPLIKGIVDIQDRVSTYADHARDFYFEILLAIHPCPACGLKMEVAASGQWRCDCSATLDPAIEFQRSACCKAPLRRRRCHYACAQCGATVVSQFLFNEKVFDAQYFCEKMTESRQRQRRRREALRRLLAASRSPDLLVDDFPDGAAIHSLSEAMDDLLRSQSTVDADDCHEPAAFRIKAYRAMVLACLDGCAVGFDALPQIGTDRRLDRARRFITLLFMEQAGEVWIEQREQGISVMPYETYVKG